MSLFDNPIARIQQFIEVGGPVVVLLLALSVISVSVALFKLWQFKSLKLGTEKGLHEIVSLALRLKRQHAGLESTRSDIEDVLAVTANAQIKTLQRGFRVLDTIAQIAPLIGLFGTVLGMITAFQALQSTGAQADPTILAGGIWEALLTTAAGMAVAIPAGVALVWIESLADGVQADLEDAVTQIFTRAPVMEGE